MLYCRTIGKGEELVFLHGWGFNSDIFNTLIKSYSSNYRLTLIDLPGHGRSPLIAGGIEQWAEAVIAQLPPNPKLVGWSLGGLLAIQIARKISTSGLTLVASSPRFTKHLDWEFGIDSSHFSQFEQTLARNSTQGLKRFVSLQTKNKDLLKKLNTSLQAFPAKSEALTQGLKILLNTDFSSNLIKLDTPIQAILGEQDTLVPIKIASWYQANNIPTTIINTGHLPFLHPDFLL
jgi:pimeloyl-[acyl-carrier protein] methyl ester esterase